MANTFNNIADIVPVAMEVLENNLVLTKHVNREYDDRFKDSGKIGDTANIRIPGFYTVGTGSAVTPQSYNDTYKSVVLTQKHVPVQFTSKELALNVDDFKANVLDPMLAPLANTIDADGYDLFNTVSNYTGVAGTLPTDLSGVLDAKAMLDEYAVPNDGNRFAILPPRQVSSIANGLRTLFNPTKDIEKQYREGTLGTIVGNFKFSESANTPTHTTGTFAGTPAINGSTSDGATTLDVDGFTGGTSYLNKGDIISIAGVYSVNPVTKRSTGQLKQFVVTTTTTESGGEMATLPVSPALILTGPNQNVSALPLNNALVYVFGANAATYSNKTSTVGYCGHKNGLVLATADLPKVGPDEMCTRVKSKRLNMSMRLVKWYNGSSDQLLYRFDVLYGWALLRPDHLIRHQG